MILEEVGLRDQFSATNLDDYRQKFQTLAKRVLNGDTHFYDRMEMYDRLFSPQEMPDYAESMMWVYHNAERMKKSDQKRFEIGEDFNFIQLSQLLTIHSTSLGVTLSFFASSGIGMRWRRHE